MGVNKIYLAVTKLLYILPYVKMYLIPPNTTGGGCLSSMRIKMMKVNTNLIQKLMWQNVLTYHQH